MAGKKKAAKKKSTSSPKSFEVPEEMKQWSALLSQEVASWPGVQLKKMFGMVSCYRKDLIFAALPDKRGYFSPYSIIFKLQEPSKKETAQLAVDPRVNLSFGIGAKWYGFELASPADIRGAMQWLDVAFRAVHRGKKSR
jgi:hypothetical protein